MKKLFILMIGAITFGCGENKEGAEQRVDPTNSEENVEDYSGENITPQVDLDSGSNRRLEVDTISSAEGESRQNQ